MGSLPSIRQVWHTLQEFSLLRDAQNQAACATPNHPSPGGPDAPVHSSTCLVRSTPQETPYEVDIALGPGKCLA